MKLTVPSIEFSIGTEYDRTGRRVLNAYNKLDNYNYPINSYQNKKLFKLPYVPNYAKINGHSFYITMNSKKEKSDLKKIMQEKGIQLSSHYECLHNSLFYKRKNRLIKLKNSEYFSDNLLRLPIYPDLKKSDLKKIVGNFNSYYQYKI